MRIAICDDEQEERNRICLYIKKYIKDAVISEFDNGTTLTESHRNRSFDLIVLDIIMPNSNGIDVATSIRAFDKKTPVIFTTSSTEFAVQSYRVLAFDYIVKPVAEEQIRECLNRFVAESVKPAFITINYLGVDTSIKLDSIVYIESRLHNVIFHIEGNRTLEITAKLSSFEHLCISNGFCHCHKSYIINIAHVVKLSGEEFSVTGGEIIKISRANLATAKKAYFDFVFGGDNNE